MISIVPNQKKCNVEFKESVKNKANRIIEQGYIISSIRYLKNDFNRYTGAIIKYKNRY